MCVTFGCGSVCSSSERQKVSTKSACEAELVGLSDGLGIPVQLQNFLLTTGYKLPPVLAMQDSTSATFLAASGRSSSGATRHAGTRYFWVCDRAKRKQAELKHVVTLLVTAGVLTKPAQGVLLTGIRCRLLGHD